MNWYLETLVPNMWNVLAPLMIVLGVIIVPAMVIISFWEEFVKIWKAVKNAIH